MKQIVQALGLAWGVLWLVGCAGGASEPNRDRLLRGDRTGNLSVEHENGVVQDLQTGRIGYRRGAWIQDAQTGKLIFTYGDFIEEEKH